MFAAPLAALSLLSVVSAADYQVKVGDGGLTFTPNFVNAVAGDTVTFTFVAKNHTVTETSFGNVCHPLLKPEDGSPVFDSGFEPVAAGQTDNLPTFTYHVPDTNPHWFFCKQKGHCGQGMVFAVNCPIEGPNSLDNFIASAKAFGAQEAAQSAAQQSWAATATSEVIGGQTYAPVYAPVVTDTVTLGSEVWTTTYSSYANSPDPTPVDAEGATHTVVVGKDGTLTFNPPVIAAKPRDKVVFQFVSKNHTVTQSSFANPCKKLETTSTTGAVGIDSGFMPVDPATTDNFPTYTLTVNDTNPAWFYCRQKTPKSHCGSGMVFSINPDESSDRNSEAFKALAITLNGTDSSSTNTTGQTSSDNSKGSAPSVRVGMASAVLLAVSSLFVLAC